jgi:hypothetical protein
VQRPINLYKRRHPVYHSEGNCLIETATKTLIQGCKTSVIPTDGSVQKINRYAFCGHEALTEIVIPECITEIGRSAFINCDGLENVVLNAKITEIATETFYGCDSLTTLTIPASVTKIGDSALANCGEALTVYFRGTEAQWEAIEKHENYRTGYEGETQITVVFQS